MSEETITPLSVTLRMDDSMAADLRRQVGAVALAEAFEIDSHEMAAEAVRQLQAWKAGSNKLDALYKGFVEPAKSIVERAKELFNPARTAIEQADKILRAKLVAWNEEQERIAAELRAAAAKAEREARQKAEREAAEARAIAQAKAAAEQRKADEAREAQRQAEAEGNAKAAAAAAALAARAEEKAVAAIENGDAKADAVVLEAASHVVVVEAPTPTKGLSVRDNWKAELQSDFNEARALKAIVSAIAAGRADLYAYLVIDMKAADKGAKALKGHFDVPGLVAVNKTTSVLRAA